MTQKGWIGVDLDGTLAYYDRWRGVDHIGTPVPAMLARVKLALAKGFTVKIMTARVCSAQDIRTQLAARDAIRDWTFAHLGRTLEATAEKDYAMIELWDDRAVRVEKNVGAFLSPSELNL